MEAFDSWEKEHVKEECLSNHTGRSVGWRAALEWVLELYEYRKSMESQGRLVPFKDAILKELEN